MNEQEFTNREPPAKRLRLSEPTDDDLLDASSVDTVELGNFLLDSEDFTGDAELKLNPCLLARIFNREITTWTHEDIMAINPGLSLAVDYPINIARRVLGSSSTKSITTYLHQTCPEHWPEDMVDSVVNWANDTLPCEGSGGMTECIRDNAGTIGYIDSGHGHSENLQEIDLLNFDGQYISSKVANSRGGILAAAESPNAGLPSELDGSFANVNLLNQVGQFSVVAVLFLHSVLILSLSFLLARR